MPKYIALSLVIGYIVVLTFLSLYSLVPIQSLGSTYDDKLHHFIAHTVLVLLAYNYLEKNTLDRALLIAFAISIVYGIIIEVLQLTIATSRTFDLVDLLANFLGALFAIFLLKLKEYVKINYL